MQDHVDRGVELLEASVGLLDLFGISDEMRYLSHLICRFLFLVRGEAFQLELLRFLCCGHKLEQIPHFLLYLPDLMELLLLLEFLDVRNLLEVFHASLDEVEDFHEIGVVNHALLVLG